MARDEPPGPRDLLGEVRDEPPEPWSRGHLQSVKRRRRAAVALVAADVALLVGLTLGRLTALVPPIDDLSRVAVGLGLTLHRWALKELKAGR